MRRRTPRERQSLPRPTVGIGCDRADAPPASSNELDPESVEPVPIGITCRLTVFPWLTSPVLPPLVDRPARRSAGCLSRIALTVPAIGSGHQLAYVLCIPSDWCAGMRTTINLDDELVAEAQRLTGIRGRTALVHEGLRLLIERAAARRLAKLGGSAPGAKAPPRRRPRQA
jgi:Arc/MetJ family transcription regulator